MLWTKRARFIITSLVLSLGLLAIQFVSFSWRYQAIVLVAALSYVLSFWVLREELIGIEWLTCLILPTFYTASAALFYFLLPEKIITRIAILTAFGVGMYAILLTENIFSIAAGRTIQLLRAAQAVGFLMTLITAFFIFYTIFSFKLVPWLNVMLVFLASIPLYFQAIWAIDLDKKINYRILNYTVILAFLTGQVAWAISFWPLSLLLSSLFLVSFLYIAIGLVQHEFSGRLFKKTYTEYFQVAVVVIIIMFIMAQWGE